MTATRIPIPLCCEGRRFILTLSFVAYGERLFLPKDFSIPDEKLDELSEISARIFSTFSYVNLKDVLGFDENGIIIRHQRYYQEYSKAQKSEYAKIEKIFKSLEAAGILTPLIPQKYSKTKWDLTPGHAVKVSTRQWDGFILPFNEEAEGEEPKTKGPYPKRDDAIVAEVRGSSGGDKKHKNEVVRGIDLSFRKRFSFRYQVRNGTERKTYTHRFAKNSQFQGVTYHENGKVKKVEGGISASFNRSSEKVHLMRTIEDEKGKVVCYVGRADTKKKAKELLTWVCENERKIGNEELLAASTDEGCPFKVAVLSLMDPWFLNPNEQKFVNNEMSALEVGQPDALTVQLGDREEAKVKPIFVSAPAEFFKKASTFLPPSLGQEEHISQTDDLVESVVAGDSTRQAVEATAWENLSPAQRILATIHFCRQKEIPLIIHCKSSVDRTGIAIALACAYDQWVADNNDIKLGEPIWSLFGDNQFKEMVAAHLPAGLVATEYGRGQVGFDFGEDCFYKSILEEILPKRFFKSYSILDTFDSLAHKMSATKTALLGTIIFSLGIWAALFGHKSIKKGLKEWFKSANIIEKLGQGILVTLGLVIGLVCFVGIALFGGIELARRKYKHGRLMKLSVKEALRNSLGRSTIFSGFYFVRNFTKLFPQLRLDERQFSLSGEDLVYHKKPAIQAAIADLAQDV